MSPVYIMRSTIAYLREISQPDQDLCYRLSNEEFELNVQLS